VSDAVRRGRDPGELPTAVELHIPAAGANRPLDGDARKPKLHACSVEAASTAPPSPSVAARSLGRRPPLGDNDHLCAFPAGACVCCVHCQSFSSSFFSPIGTSPFFYCEDKLVASYQWMLQWMLDGIEYARSR